jgi:putative ABC transport system permease protein
MHFCANQSDQTDAMLMIRVASGDPLRLAEPVRREMLALDPELPVADVNTMQANISASLAPRRLTMVLLGTFAGLALALASIGLYGVMAVSVTQRTRELGIRLALGAQRGAVLGLIMRQGAILVGLGLLVGLVAALAAGRLLASFVYGVPGNDPVTLGVVAAVLGAAALLACWLPAQRATRVDPNVALRNE